MGVQPLHKGSDPTQGTWLASSSEPHIEEGGGEGKEGRVGGRKHTIFKF